jgi:hypothetical protein
MHVSRGVFDVEMAVRKLSSRFRRPTQVLRPEWPVISTSRPLFYLLRFFGLAPYEIFRDRFIPWTYGVIYSIFCILFNTYAIYNVLTVSPGKKETDILETIEVAKVRFRHHMQSIKNNRIPYLFRRNKRSCTILQIKKSRFPSGDLQLLRIPIQYPDDNLDAEGIHWGIGRC